MTRATPSDSTSSATWTYYVREKWYYHDTESGQELMTGPASTDAPVLRLIDTNGDGDFDDTTDIEQHFVNDHQGSTVLVTGKATLNGTTGELISRGPIIAHVKYDQYGVPKFVHPADVNSDGVVDTLDTQHWLNAWDEYRNGASGQTPPKEIWKGVADADESGAVDTAHAPGDIHLPASDNSDWVAFKALRDAAMAPGAMPLDQQLGNLPLYAGYWWDDAIGLYHVRHRVYRPEWGRWLQRDPLGYAPGWNLYQYVNGMPWGAVDPMGLIPWSGYSPIIEWIMETEAFAGATEVVDRVFGDPYAEHSKWQMQMANMAAVNSARAARAGNDKLAQSIGMSFGLEMHNAEMNEDFLTDGSFAAVELMSSLIPTGWASGRLAGLLGNTARGAALNAFGTRVGGKIARIVGYVTDPFMNGLRKLYRQVSEGARRIIDKLFDAACFVSGTLVVTSDGEKAIEHVQVGDRVITPESIGANEEEPDSANIRKLKLSIPNPDGSLGTFDLELLRSDEWIESNGAKVGATIELSLPEMGVEGPALVLEIDDCPIIKHGPGRLVMATIASNSRNVLTIQLEGLAEPLEATATHPLFSEDRGTWVSAGDLHDGERLRTLQGAVKVVSIARKPGVHRVFNLEVQTDHVYHVSPVGVLAHNDCPGVPVELTREGKPILPREGIYEFPDVARGGKPYVGSSGDVPGRLKDHISNGRHDPKGPLSTRSVPGGKTAREIAEHRRIQEITGGVPARHSQEVANMRDPIGPNRQHLLDCPNNK